VRVTHIMIPTADGPIETSVISLPASAFSDPQRCTWLVPDIAEASPMRLSTGARTGRRCADGHLQVGGLAARNSGVPELSYTHTLEDRLAGVQHGEKQGVWQVLGA
jgi:hypothetical protein